MIYLYIQICESKSILDIVSLFFMSFTEQLYPYNNLWKSKLNWSIFSSTHISWGKAVFTSLNRIAQNKMLSAVKDIVKFPQVCINFISYSFSSGYSTATLNAQMNAKWVIELPQLMFLKLLLLVPKRLILSSPSLLVPTDTWKWRDKGTLLIFKCQEENSQSSPLHEQFTCWKRILNTVSYYLFLRLKSSLEEKKKKRGGEQLHMIYTLKLIILFASNIQMLNSPLKENWRGRHQSLLPGNQWWNARGQHKIVSVDILAGR